MYLYNVTSDILQHALDEVNRHFSGNIRFKDIEQLRGRTRQGGEKWRATLTVRSRGERKTAERGKHADGTEHKNPVRCKEFEVTALILGGMNPHSDQCSEHGLYESGHTGTCGVIWSRCPYRYNTDGLKFKHDRHGNESYLAAACWHVFGVFFDALPDEDMEGRKVRIKSAIRATYYTPSDEWRHDYTRGYGSMSEQCDCGHTGIVPSKQEVRRYGQSE